MIYDIIIVGGGISGVFCANLFSLKNDASKILIVEASDRLGGRLLSTDDGHDLGATWSWPLHDKRVTMLATDLGVRQLQESYDQVRFVGGTQQLVTRLFDQMMDRNCNVSLRTEMAVKDIDHSEIGLIKVNACDLQSQKMFTFDSKTVVMAVTPQLIVKNIIFRPELPPSKVQAMIQTPIWMGDASKMILIFSEPFWLKTKCDESKKIILPMFISHNTMIFDASQQNKYSLCVFSMCGSLNESDTLDKICKIFGSNYKDYLVNTVLKNWADAEWVSNGKGGNVNEFGNPILRDPIDNRIFFASTETEDEAGHIEGALKSSFRVVEQYFLVSR